MPALGPGGEQWSDLKAWLEREVRGRLEAIEGKLEQALHGQILHPHGDASTATSRFGEATATLALSELSIAGANRGTISTARDFQLQSNIMGDYLRRQSTIGELTEQRRAMIEVMTYMQFRNSSTWGRTLERVRAFLEEPDSSWGAKAYERAATVITLFCVAITLVEAADPPPLGNVSAAAIEVCIEVVFALELLLRFVVSPAKRFFFYSAFNLIDVLSILPLALRIAEGVVVNIQNKDRDDKSLALLLGFVPVIRLLKVLRRFHKFHLLLRAFKLALEAMPVIVFILGSLILLASALIYLVEPADNVDSFPTAMWLAIESLTTVGYGDIYPVSGLGRFCTMTLVFSTELYMAIPLGIIGDAFRQVWEERHSVLLTQVVRSKLRGCGYVAEDIPMLFRLFDVDNDNFLSFPEFEAMFTELNLGLSSERITELFHLADPDGKGVKAQEFLMLLFPPNPSSELREDSIKASPASAARASLDKALTNPSRRQRAALRTRPSGASNVARSGGGSSWGVHWAETPTSAGAPSPSPAPAEEDINEEDLNDEEGTSV